jgi:hypothetical protein
MANIGSIGLAVIGLLLLGLGTDDMLVTMTAYEEVKIPPLLSFPSLLSCFELF